MFTVDGIAWTIPCDITRTADVRSTSISGDLLDGSYFNDVQGTYMSYEIDLVPNPQQMGDYYALYQVLTAPVDGHTFVFPYDGETIQLTARVGRMSDIWVRLPNGGRYWKGLRVPITANHASRQQTLAEAIARGMSPMPPAEAVSVGDTYTMTANGWVKVEDE